MFFQYVLVYTHKIQNKPISNGIVRRYDLSSFGIWFNPNVPAIINQSRQFSLNKMNEKQCMTRPPPGQSKFSADMKSLIEELKEKAAKMAKIYNEKEWKEEETNLLLMTREIHGNQWKFIHENYFNYRTLHSIKCKWDREKLKYENSCKKIISEWTPEEDEILLKGIKKYGKGHWRKISRMLPNKEAMQVFRRYYVINCTKRGNFTEEEDNLLCDLIKKYGGNCWQKIADEMNRPVATLIRHYKKVLLNSAKFPEWADQENELIRESILKYGKDWKKIQKLLPHRLSISIKEHVKFCPLADPYYSSGFWKVGETMKLVKAVRMYGKSWQKVSKFVETRSPFQCRIHFRDIFTKKNLEPYVLNLELKGIQNIFPTEDQDFLEKLVIKQLLVKLRSSEQELKGNSLEPVSSSNHPKDS